MIRMRTDFFAESLGMGTSMVVLMPQAAAGIGMGGADAAAGAGAPEGGPGVPVLYLLHGLSDDCTIWERRTSIERYATEKGIAVVMPEVRRSFYTDEAVGEAYWTFVAEELPQLIARTFRVSTAREDTFAAGLSMGASLLAKGIFQVELEGVPGSFLLENLGYTFGFIIVIMARQQLFTENTVTAVLPVMQKPTMSNVGLLMRLWGVVLLGNILGTGIAAWAFEYMPIFNEETRDAFVKIGMDVMKNTPSEMFANAIISGWLIATMVWMFPAAGAAKIVVIILMTWLIALGDTTHIVVGSVEILYLVFNGTLHWSDFIWPFALPTLAGNICGGTFIFALMSHAQIRNDMSNKRKAEARQKAERAENIKKNYKNPA